MKHTLLILVSLVVVGCGSDRMPNEAFIAESAICEAGGFAAQPIKSQYDGDVIGVQCYTPRKFEPTFLEFNLDDGTRCVQFSTPAESGYRSGPSGVSCDWDSAE